MNIRIILFKIRRKINVLLTKIKLRNNFKENKSYQRNYVKKEKIYDFDSFCNNFIYKNENWNYIKNLPSYLDSLFDDKTINYNDNECEKRYKITENTLSIRSSAKINNWNCFYLKNVKDKNLEIKFDVQPKSFLQEIQIAFNYKNLGNRYRFMIHNNSEAVFEQIYRGVFYENIYSKKVNIEKNKKYTIKVVIINNIYSYYINEECIFSIKDKGQIISGENLVLIFYNGKDNDNVEIDISNVEISSLQTID